MDRGRQEKMAYTAWLIVSFVVICAVFYACMTHSIVCLAQDRRKPLTPYEIGPGGLCSTHCLFRDHMISPLEVLRFLPLVHLGCSPKFTCQTWNLKCCPAPLAEYCPLCANKFEIILTPSLPTVSHLLLSAELLYAFILIIKLKSKVNRIIVLCA